MLFAARKTTKRGALAMVQRLRPQEKGAKGSKAKPGVNHHQQGRNNRVLLTMKRKDRSAVIVHCVNKQ